jgi:hypothetical protein
MSTEQLAAIQTNFTVLFKEVGELKMQIAQLSSKKTKTKIPQRKYVEIPFELKDKAKAFGFFWDMNAKSWYVPDHITDAQEFIDQWTKNQQFGDTRKYSPKEKTYHKY